jgi:putative endonuclease
MARHNDLGKKAEELAAGWLEQQGYEILDRNWRHGRYEVDIIALRGDTHHFIEVKAGTVHEAGTTPAFGYPEERIDNKKIRNLMRAAAAWLHPFQSGKKVEYDALSITMTSKGDPEFFLIRDLYLH